MPETSAEFSAAPESSGDVLEKRLEHRLGANLRLSHHKPDTLPLRHCILILKGSVASIMRFSGRFFSHLQQDFPAVSVFTGRDFPAVAFLARGILKNSMCGRQIVLVLTAGFSGGKLNHSVSIGMAEGLLSCKLLSTSAACTCILHSVLKDTSSSKW